MGEMRLKRMTKRVTNPMLKIVMRKTKKMMMETMGKVMRWVEDRHEGDDEDDDGKHSIYLNQYS